MASATADRSRALFALTRKNRGRWVALAVMVAVSSALTIFGPLVIRRVVDDVIDGTDAGHVRELAVVFLASVVAGQLMAVLVVRSAMATAWDTTNDLRIRITRHVLGLDHEFHRRHTPGDLISRVDGDVTSVSDFLGTVVPKALGAVLLVVGIIGVLTVIDWRLGIGMLVYVAIAFSLVGAMRHRSVRESEIEMGANGKLYGGIEERINASEDLRANGAAAHAMWRLVEDSRGVISTAVRRERAFIGMWWVVQGSIVLGTVIAISVSALLVDRGAMSVGTAFLLFQYILLLGRPLEEFVHELETVQMATGAMVRVVDLLDVEPKIIDRGTTSPPTGALAVDFDAVQFDYGDDQPVLVDVDVAIEQGRSVGIVGRTGSGKTTFSRLVLRLVEASSGQVRLGGVPIEEIAIDELRRRVALVPQEVELFGGTVRDNVTLFDPAPTDVEVEVALRSVGLDSLADAGIHRDLGARGGGMSAGEAQLLAMARVWLRRPDIVVLDEATARVDPDTEARLEHAVRKLREGRTTLVIAHRLSTLREVDDVMVFHGGRVVEFGERNRLAADPASRFHRLLALALEDESSPGAGTLGFDPGEVDLADLADADDVEALVALADLGEVPA